MLTSLPEYLRTGRYREAVGRVPVKCPNGCRDFALSNSACQGAKGWDKWRCDYAFDPRCILIADDPGEAESMCEAVGTCSRCGCPLRPLGDGTKRTTLCSGDCQDFALIPTTHRLFAWNGEPVEWEAVLYETCDQCCNTPLCPDHNLREDGCSKCGKTGLAPRRLTAVLLVGGGPVHHSCSPTTGECGGCDAHTWRLGGCDCIACHGEKSNLVQTARQACASAGVQFVGTRGRLEL